MVYNLFISHSWSHEDQYYNLKNLLNNYPRFEYKDYSVPRNDPIHYASNTKQLKEAIRRQMAPASCVLILAGVYSSYSKWINIEIDLAKEMGKKIIAVRPYGAERVSDVATEAADVVVHWNSTSIIDAIRK